MEFGICYHLLLCCSENCSVVLDVAVFLSMLQCCSRCCSIINVAVLFSMVLSFCQCCSVILNVAVLLAMVLCVPQCCSQYSNVILNVAVLLSMLLCCSQWCSVALDGQSRWSISLSNNKTNLLPFSLAYDWRGGQIFLTDEDSFEIKLVTIDGRGRGSMVDSSKNNAPGYMLSKPGELAVDSSRRSVFFLLLFLSLNMCMLIHKLFFFLFCFF